MKLATGTTHTQSQSERAREATAEVLDWPAGRWIVGIAGLCVIGAGLYNGYRGLTCKFAERWNTGEMSAAVRRWATRIGVVGLLARLVVFGLIGAFAVKAALEYDPKEAIGLDGALQKLAHQSYGPLAARPDGRRPPRVRDLLLRGRALPQGLIVAPRRGRLHRGRRDALRGDLRLAAARAVLRQLDGRLGERDRADPRLPVDRLLVRRQARGPAARARAARAHRARRGGWRSP